MSSKQRQRSDCVKNTSNSQNEAITKFFAHKNNIDSDDIPHVENKSVDEIQVEITKGDHEAINKLMLYILSPELNRNETQKRFLKQKLVKYIQGMLIAQLGVVGVGFLLISIILSISVFIEIKNDWFFNNIQHIFDFFKYYITAIIVEFITMLFFIVKFVFDKSIVGLLNETIKTKYDKK